MRDEIAFVQLQTIITSKLSSVENSDCTTTLIYLSTNIHYSINFKEKSIYIKNIILCYQYIFSVNHEKEGFISIVNIHKLYLLLAVEFWEILNITKLILNSVFNEITLIVKSNRYSNYFYDTYLNFFLSSYILDTYLYLFVFVTFVCKIQR